MHAAYRSNTTASVTAADIEKYVPKNKCNIFLFFIIQKNKIRVQRRRDATSRLHALRAEVYARGNFWPHRVGAAGRFFGVRRRRVGRGGKTIAPAAGVGRYSSTQAAAGKNMGRWTVRTRFASRKWRMHGAVVGNLNRHKKKGGTTAVRVPVLFFL